MRTLVITVVAALVATRVATAAPATPEAFITIASTHSSASDDATRDSDVAALRHALDGALAHTPQLTLRADEARKLGLAERRIDVTLAALDVAPAIGHVALCAELRIVVSDARGKLLAQVATTATLDVPDHAYRAGHLEALRKRVLSEAADGIVRPLRVRLAATGAGRRDHRDELYASTR